jgi:hypothetical protein
LTDLIRDAADSDDGTVVHLFAKPGQAGLQPKVTYVARLHPEPCVAAGAYVDDLTAFHATLLRLARSAG